MKHAIHSDGNTDSEGRSSYILKKKKKHSCKEANILLYGWCLAVAALNIPLLCIGTMGRLNTCLLSAAVKF